MTDRRPPTMADIARIAGVSPMTVSRAFKGGSAVSAATRTAVMEAAEGLGYVFDTTASHLRSQRTDFVAVTVPSINNANFAETVAALTEGVKPAGLQILLGATAYDPEEEARAIEQLLRRRPEAIVVTGGRHNDRARRLLERTPVPVIETWDWPEAPIGHVIGFSNRKAMRGIVEHLASFGLRRIAFLGGEDARDPRGAERRAGFEMAMRAQGLPADRLLPAGTPPVSMREGAEGMARLLEGHPDTQAVVCVSDLVAFGALAECQRRGLRVPQDIGIAGFGDYEIARVCHPTLSTIDPFPTRIGARAAELILALREGRQDGPARIELTPRLMLRGSTR